MKQFYLVETTTKDKLIHQGIFYKPSRPGKKAILWMHGLASTFYSNISLLTEFATQCEVRGIGFASFNNRGHDIVTGVKKVDRSSEKGYTRVGGGAGIETFTDAIHDIDAGVAFLSTQGFSQVVVVGHSTGSNKTCYYAATQNNNRIAGYVLAGPVSDLYAPGVDHAEISKKLQKMKMHIKSGKGDVFLEGLYDFPMTPKRYVSLFSETSNEDMYDYFGTGKKLRPFLSKIRKPLLIVLGERDEYLNKPVKEALDIFDQYAATPKYKSLVIQGGLHSFNGQEKEVVSAILRWASQI